MNCKTFSLALVRFFFFCVCVQCFSAHPSSAKHMDCMMPESASCVTCTCMSKNVTLRVVNVLKEPRFAMSLQLPSTHEKYLLGIMQEAADKNSSFRFTATYFNRELGFFVDAYNKVFGNYSQDKSYWRILDGSMKPTPVGVSNYVPVDGEIVTFNLTVGGHQSESIKAARKGSSVFAELLM